MGHNSKHGCERCLLVDERLENRTTFHNQRAGKRTEANFRDRLHANHHKEATPLLAIKFNIVSNFVLDYLHLCCFGASKRCFNIWQSDPRHKLSKNNLKQLSDMIEICASSMPSQFNRKGRGLNEFCHWKAVEFRLFFLYTGIVILKKFCQRISIIIFYILLSPCVYYCLPPLPNL